MDTAHTSVAPPNHSCSIPARPGRRRRGRSSPPSPRALRLGALAALALLLALAVPSLASASEGRPALRPVKGEAAFPVSVSAGGAKLKLLGEKGGLLHEYECQAQSGSGKLSAAKEGSLTLKLTGCLYSKILSCGNVKSGEIETKALKTLLAYTLPEKSAQAGREVGVVLAPASGEVFAEFKCGENTVVVKGSVIAAVSPLNTTTAALSLSLAQAGGVQSISQYEPEGGGKVSAGLTCKRNAEAAEKCGLGSTTALALAGEEAEVAADGTPLSPAFSPYKAIGLTGSTGTSTFHEATGPSWNYTEGTLEGVVSGPQSLKHVNIDFKNGSTLEACDNGTHERELQWNGLNGTLGYINKAEKVVGIRLEPASQPIAKCTMGFEALEYVGSVVARVSPTNVKTSKLELRFESNLALEGETPNLRLKPSLGEGVALKFESTAKVFTEIETDVLG